MRWYINDLSLQNQFQDRAAFEAALRGLLKARLKVEFLRQNLRVARALGGRAVHAGETVRHAIQESQDRELRRAVLLWFDRYGPFLDDDRQAENDDYFEYQNVDVTDGGLGEAARRKRVGQSVATFSFIGGPLKFDQTPLYVDHGLPEDRLGQYAIDNLWGTAQLEQSAIEAGPPIESWRALIEVARIRFPKLVIPNGVYLDRRLDREPFDPVIRDRALELFGHLNAYMDGRQPDGADGPAAREIINNYFIGERALFSGESSSNQNAFKSEMTFDDPELLGQTIFAHWHGKISRRYYRIHFEWPIPKSATKLKVFYLGPKITKS